jgi:hypothetical protein
MAEINKPFDPAGETKPVLWDGFGFFLDKLDGLVKFYYFDDFVKIYGESPRDPEIPGDREAFHVMLSSIRKEKVWLDAPFTSNFLDPFVYAKNLALAGFSGVMLKKTQWSATLLAQSEAYMRILHHQDKGYMYTDKDGTETFYPGLKNANT